MFPSHIHIDFDFAFHTKHNHPMDKTRAYQQGMDLLSS